MSIGKNRVKRCYIFFIIESAQKKIKVEAEGDIHIPDLSGSSSYQDIAAEEEEEEDRGFYTDWGQLIQSKVGA